MATSIQWSRRAPSVAALMRELRMTKDEATQAREAMRRGKLGQVKAAGFYGVETVRDEDGNWVFSYLNSGDSYSPTIVRRAGSDTYRISTIGDEVEALERQGVKIQ